VIKGSKGVALGCSSAYDVCVLKVDGYYHGKVLGLFGKFNHETYDDMTTPNGEVLFFGFTNELYRNSSGVKLFYVTDYRKLEHFCAKLEDGKWMP
jgi:hypothetical protein